jgi:hypothetical protein
MSALQSTVARVSVDSISISEKLPLMIETAAPLILALC